MSVSEWKNAGEICAAIEVARQRCLIGHPESASALLDELYIFFKTSGTRSFSEEDLVSLRRDVKRLSDVLSSYCTAIKRILTGLRSEGDADIRYGMKGRKSLCETNSLISYMG